MILADDSTAIYMLRTIANARLNSASSDSSEQRQFNSTDPSSPQLRAALAAAFDDASHTPCSEGDLARAALDMLSQDPDAEPIQVMASRGSTPVSPERYFYPTGIALTTEALLCSGRESSSRDNTGKWSVEVDKKAAGDSVIKQLVQPLLAFLPHGPFGGCQP
jgi:hypothetical protein